MVKYMKKHEKLISESLKEQRDLDFLKKYHKNQIEIIQHERLIHLLVTLFFGLFFLLSVLFAVVFEKMILLSLSAVFLILLIPYVFHYYKLENGVQKWYKIYNEIAQDTEQSSEKLSEFV
ncbi:hypothetical protein RBH29_15670 [Herbivorax sp. ANBcel31]|uniref:hypothetical protein n=1 Tax=Herbivorax sp. ANBcel31 TaxID=3069754 RepID=UPI0027B6DDF8|nr:hypothetical protein [Herbivorax sp. ANBcel31]MDQ2087869.1 hypothetical protein [Herbivorax sp. ANBcel31]